MVCVQASAEASIERIEAMETRAATAEFARQKAEQSEVCTPRYSPRYSPRDVCREACACVF